MQLFYAPDITPPLHTLSEEESKHCVRVLRLGRGDTLHITDGRGNLFCCEITDDNPKRCTVRVTETRAGWEALPYSLTMAVAPTKNADRFEWFLEKATEVGVERRSSRSKPSIRERRVLQARTRRTGHHGGHEAVAQSLPSHAASAHAFRRSGAPMPFEGRKFIAHCAPAQSPEWQSATCPATLRRGEAALILIGPEGDFSPEEIAFARAKADFEEITLGRAAAAHRNGCSGRSGDGLRGKRLAIRTKRSASPVPPQGGTV